jgi:hypothetical protein
MKLNRNNYEEYFILYLDNELAAEDRLQVESFVQENPDLKAELDLLLQSKLLPDTDISFADKGPLMRFENPSVSLHNYEEWLISYIDNELTGEERKEVEQFVAADPSIQKEFSVLQQTKLPPEEIVFPYKESLYRREEKVRVVSIRWRRIAAAAVLLLGISTAAIVLLKKPGKPQIDLTKNQPKEKITPVDTPVNPPENATQKKQEVIVTNDQKQKAPIKEIIGPGVRDKDKNIAKEKNKQSLPLKTGDEVLVKEQKKTNDVPQPTNNPFVNGKADSSRTKDVIVKKDIPKEIINPRKESEDVVTVSNLQPSDRIEQPDGKKNKLRGFFRKVTRTFEKRTNIKATDDDDDHLLIAGLSIKLN